MHPEQYSPSPIKDGAPSRELRLWQSLHIKFSFTILGAPTREVILMQLEQSNVPPTYSGAPSNANNDVHL